MELVLYIFITLAASLIVWKGGDLLESSSEALAKYYQLPPLVQGSIITAVGSSFPELSTTVLSTLIHGEFDLGVSAIVGSAIFNILVIPGISVILAGKLKTDRVLVYKDAQFYITSVAVLLLAFSLAVIYHPADGGELKGNMTRNIALIPLGLYVLYLFLQQQDTSEYRENKKREKPDIKPGKEWLKLLLSLLLILGSVEGLVRSAIFFGEYFNTPSFIWGVTVVAAATSVPDAVVSIKVATRKNGMVSIGNVLGSNVFDLLVAIPAGIMIAGTAIVDFSVAIPMMFFLTVATIVLFTFLRTRLTLFSWEGWILLGLYIVFIVWIWLETIGVTNFVYEK